MRDEVRREYQTDQIAVLWQPERCIHWANCIRGLPRVFDPGSRPWVHLDAATADAIADVVMTCPTGALHFRRLDGGPQEQAPTPTTVRTVPNGPLFVRGDVEVLAPDGDVIRRDTRMALCRCGQSAHKPFCDGSHRAAGLRDGGVTVKPR
jgi:uncharacterized Fe-S cluster protein YjdI/CDGSH-type Zn-finger protein